MKLLMGIFNPDAWYSKAQMHGNSRLHAPSLQTITLSLTKHSPTALLLHAYMKIDHFPRSFITAQPRRRLIF